MDWNWISSIERDQTFLVSLAIPCHRSSRFSTPFFTLFFTMVFTLFFTS